MVVLIIIISIILAIVVAGLLALFFSIGDAEPVYPNEPFLRGDVEDVNKN